MLLLGLTGVGGWALWTWHHEVLVWIMFIETRSMPPQRGICGSMNAGRAVAWGRRALILRLGVATLARIALIFAPPVSTDICVIAIYGMVVQAAGINPYLYRPGDAQVALSHDEPIYSNINRAETAVDLSAVCASDFSCGHRVSEQVSVMKAAMVGFEVLATMTLMAMLRRRGFAQNADDFLPLASVAFVRVRGQRPHRCRCNRAHAARVFASPIGGSSSLPVWCSARARS